MIFLIIINKDLEGRIKKNLLGYIGEVHCLYRLALVGIKASKLSDFHDYDILTYNDIRIEVKTATKAERRKKYKLQNGTYSYTQPYSLWGLANYNCSTSIIERMVSYNYAF